MRSLGIILALACSLMIKASAATPDSIVAEPFKAPAVMMPATVAVAADSLQPLAEGAVPKFVPKKNLIEKVIDYFNESNKPKKNKKFDFSVIGGPYYSSDTKFGIGLVAAGLYRTSRRDSMMAPSDVALYFNATTSMFFKLGLRGTHIMPRDRMRIHYDVNFSSVATRFWGIGYERNVNDDNESTYKYLNSQAEVHFLWRLAPNFYIGPTIMFDYINGRKFQKPWLWEGEDHRTFNLGVGFTIQYDNRDFLTNASHGVYLRIDQRFNPRFLLNRYAFSGTALQLAYYHPLWRSATIAMQFRSTFTYGNTPWGLLPTLGGSDNMRGYFEGRYRDKCEMDACIELRQHVWRRNGLAVWIGAGTVFPSLSALRWNKVLPNYGIGYRWEFKKRVNVRLDLGFGKHQTGIIFSINEAF